VAQRGYKGYAVMPIFLVQILVPITRSYLRWTISFLDSYLSATSTKLCHIKRDHHHAENVHYRPQRTLDGRT